MASRCFQCWFGLLAACLFLLAAVPGAAGLPAQVSNNAVCIADGISDTAKYRRAVMIGSYFLPVYSTVDLTAPLQVKNLLIIQHGAGGEANNYFCDAVNGTRSLGSSIGVVAPYFGNEAVTLRRWTGSKARGAASINSLYWEKTHWNAGAASVNQPKTSSFGALDHLLKIVTACNRHATCGRQVIVTGFSAGGQTVQRYAWATTYGAATSRKPVKVKFVVSDPGTYLYFDTMRPQKDPCRPRRDTGPTWNCTDFADISKTDEYYSCQDFNDWKLGLSNLADAGPYLSGLSSTDTAALSVAYLSKKIFYILGEDDVCNCLSKEVTNPAICIRPNQTCSPVGEDTSPNCCDMPAPITRNVMIDISCGDMLEGSNRLQRGLLFISYLRVFAVSQGVTFTPQFTTVPGMGHDANKLYTVPAFLNYLSS